MKNNLSFESSLAKFGIGLFETIKVKEGKANLSLHMDRIFNSIKELNININYKREFLESEILNYIKEHNICNKALRLTIFDEGYNISTRDIPYNNKSYEQGFKLNISPIERGNSILYKHKTTNYFENIYTKNYANNYGFNDGIFTDMNNYILECSMSNIFFIKEDVLYTPSNDLPILSGTTKRRILEVCDEFNITVRESLINIEEIKNFDFVFVTNALMGAMKVIQIEDIIYDEKNKLFEKILTYLNES
ncbi:aminotransferase class IV [Clostridium sp. CCUG 7971]|uniref:aminotransferase class IV n=1 Tax=Clostridium sp. CCUG 7971 TaxID=2811414 RepID=UPI001ABA230B|nr:aminotransferase class IV [Clostridium sp. CCUG 7971]MBO3445002.1 aminotransferase class IV family protein [Clostridium sp. CCUG 7971]